MDIMDDAVDSVGVRHVTRDNYQTNVILFSIYS